MVGGPGRRAVLRVTTDEGVVWVKVVRPRRIERIVTKMTAIAAIEIHAPWVNFVASTSSSTDPVRMAPNGIGVSRH